MVLNNEALSRLNLLIRQITLKMGTQRTVTGSLMNLTSLQAEALSMVEKNDNITMSKLAQEIAIVKPSASRIADEMVKKGLLKRINDRGDRRITRLQLTSKGQRALDSVRTESYAMLERVLARLSQEQQADLMKSLELLIDAITESEQISNQNQLM